MVIVEEQQRIVSYDPSVRLDNNRTLLPTSLRPSPLYDILYVAG